MRFERCHSQTHVKIISTDALMRRGIICLSPINVKLFVPKTSKSLLVQYPLTAVDRVLNPQPVLAPDQSGDSITIFGITWVLECFSQQSFSYLYFNLNINDYCVVKRCSNNTMSKLVKGLSKASSSCFFSTPKHFFDRRMAAFFLDLFLVREEFPSLYEIQ